MFNQKKKGQGVVEYAGAIVVAAAIVAAVLSFAPTALSSLFTDIIGAIKTFFQGEITGLGN